MAELQQLLAETCPPFSDEVRTEPRLGEASSAATPWPERIDSDLLDACVAGDESAWRHLHRQCYPRAAAFLRKLGVRDLELDDAAQEVFVQLFRYLPSFRREAELSTWLYRVCITQARSARRRRRVTQTLSRLLSLGSAPSLVSTPSLPDAIVRRRVESALASLSEGERAVFVLYEMEGLPGKRIAEIVASPEASVWRRLHDARRSFRRALEAEEQLA
ncbi:MAG: sigma-70 family RNA polymerase sigma factor [Myxococcales bacterium]|jgi:RNA polymerase sigma-70 factor (ECF subfamily)